MGALAVVGHGVAVVVDGVGAALHGDAGHLAGVQGVLHALPVVGGEVGMQHAVHVQLPPPLQLIQEVVADAAVEVAAVVLLHPSIGDAEAGVRAGVEQVGDALGGQRALIALGLDFAQQLGIGGLVGLLQEGGVAGAGLQHVRAELQAHVHRGGPQLVGAGFKLRLQDGVAVHRGLEVGGGGHQVGHVHQGVHGAQVGRVDGRALDVDQVIDLLGIPGQQHVVHEVRVAGGRLADPLQAHVQRGLELLIQRVDEVLIGGDVAGACQHLQGDDLLLGQGGATQTQRQRQGKQDSQSLFHGDTSCRCFFRHVATACPAGASTAEAEYPPLHARAVMAQGEIIPSRRPPAPRW